MIPCSLWRAVGRRRKLLVFPLTQTNMKALYCSHIFSLFLSLQGAQPSDQPAACWLELRAQSGKGRWALAPRVGCHSTETDAAGLHRCQNPAVEAETDTARGEAPPHTHPPITSGSEIVFSWITDYETDKSVCQLPEKKAQSQFYGNIGQP